MKLKLCGMILAFVMVWVIDADDSIPKIVQCGRYYEKGIYMNFDEFLNNNPSKKGTYAKHEDQLKYLDEKGKTQTYTGSMWGYTGGQDIYIKYNYKLMPLTLFKYYSLISDNKSFTIGGPATSFGTNYSTGIDVRYQKVYVLGMKSGKIEKLTRNVLTKIIEDDNELMKQFEAEENKKANLSYYLVRYNQRKDSTTTTGTLNTPDK